MIGKKSAPSPSDSSLRNAARILAEAAGLASTAAGAAARVVRGGSQALAVSALHKIRPTQSDCSQCIVPIRTSQSVGCLSNECTEGIIAGDHGKSVAD
jgi:hypothetical protein